MVEMTTTRTFVIVAVIMGILGLGYMMGTHQFAIAGPKQGAPVNVSIQGPAPANALCANNPTVTLGVRAKNTLSTTTPEYLATNTTLLFTDQDSETVATYANSTYGQATRQAACGDQYGLFVNPNTHACGYYSKYYADPRYPMKTVETNRIDPLLFSVQDQNPGQGGNGYISSWGDTNTTTNTNASLGAVEPDVTTNPYNLVLHLEVNGTNSQYGCDKLLLCTKYDITKFQEVSIGGGTKMDSVPTLASADGNKECYVVNPVFSKDGTTIAYSIKLVPRSGVNPTNADSPSVYAYDWTKYLGSDGFTVKEGISDDNTNDIGGANPHVLINIQ